MIYTELTKKALNNIMRPNMKMVEFPKGFFEKRIIDITYDEYVRLTERIFELGLTDITDHLNHIIPPGAMPHHLRYALFDGTIHSWREYITPPEPFNKIALLLDYFCDYRKILTDEEITEKIYPKTTVKASKTIIGWSLPCCSIRVPKSYKYCPQCGKEINHAEKCEFEYDIEKTISLCRVCGNNLPYEDKYCGFCGNKSWYWNK